MTSNKSKSERIIEALSESSMSNAACAIARIAKPNHMFIRIMWFIFLIVSCGFCSFLILRNIFEYLDFEVVTKVDMLYEKTTFFPAITICNLSPTHGDFSIELIKQISENNSINYTTIDPKNRFLIMSNLFHRLQNDTQKQKIGLRKDQFIRICFFDTAPCNETDISWHYDFYYGNCFKFDTKEIITAFSNGKMGGLNLEIDVGDTGSIGLSQTSGVHLFINNRTQRISSMNEGIDVPTGKSTSIVIDRTISYKMPKPFSDCIKDAEGLMSKYSQKLLNAGFKYENTDCLELCFSDYIYNKCQCYEASTYNFFSVNQNHRICMTNDDVICINRNRKNFNTKENLEACDCPFECDTTSFSLTTSQSDFPNDYYGNLILNDTKLNGNKSFLTVEDLKKSRLSINIYYEDLKTTYIYETPKLSLVELVANIGGVVGLFVGASMLSILEAIEFGFRLTQILLSNKSKKVNSIAFSKNEAGDQ